MEWISKEVIGIIAYLLPGFLAAWVFHGLTPHPKQTPFERVVQALIFTTIIQGIVAAARLSYEYHYNQGSIDWGKWGEITNQVLPPVVAVAIGLLFALLANKDWIHAALRWLGVTKRTSYPSNWFSAFNKDRRYVTLHLKNGRRIYGWPYEFPDQSDSGHFALMCAHWVPDDGDCIPLPLVDRLLIPAKDVEMVELMKEQEVTQTQQVQLKGENDGKPSSTAPAPESETTLRTDRVQGIERTATRESRQADGVPAAAPKENIDTPNGRRRKGRR